MFSRNGRTTMRWAAAALALLSVTLTLNTPQSSSFLVNADVVEEVKSMRETVKETVKGGIHGVKAAIKGEDEDELLPEATVEVLTEENFESVTQAATGATTGDWFVEFYAPWCGHCRKLDGPWTELAQKLGGKVNVGKVDVTENKALGKRFGIKSFPTLLMFSHGQVYKFSEARKLDVLLDYAKGGFKETEASPVPLPRSLAGGVKGMFAGVVTDIKGLKGGNMPSATTFAVLGVSLLVMLLAFAVLLPSKGSPPKRSGTTRTKVE